MLYSKGSQESGNKIRAGFDFYALSSVCPQAPSTSRPETSTSLEAQPALSHFSAPVSGRRGLWRSFQVNTFDAVPIKADAEGCAAECMARSITCKAFAFTAASLPISHCLLYTSTSVGSSDVKALFYARVGVCETSAWDTFASAGTGRIKDGTMRIRREGVTQEACEALCLGDTGCATYGFTSELSGGLCQTTALLPAAGVVSNSNYDRKFTAFARVLACAKPALAGGVLPATALTASPVLGTDKPSCLVVFTGPQPGRVKKEMITHYRSGDATVTLDVCRADCLERKTCLAFSYRSGNKFACMLSDRPAGESHQMDQAYHGMHAFYERRTPSSCGTAPPTVTTAATTQAPAAACLLEDKIFMKDGGLGRVKDEYAVGFGKDRTADGCAALCTSNTHCVGFVHRPDYNDCKLSSQPSSVALEITAPWMNKFEYYTLGCPEEEPSMCSSAIRSFTPAKPGFFVGMGSAIIATLEAPSSPAVCAERCLRLRAEGKSCKQFVFRPQQRGGTVATRCYLYDDRVDSSTIDFDTHPAWTRKRWEIYELLPRCITHAATATATTTPTTDDPTTTTSTTRTTPAPVTVATLLGDCEYTLSECTENCEAGAGRSMNITRQANGGKACPAKDAIPDCQPRDGHCAEVGPLCAAGSGCFECPPVAATVKTTAILPRADPDSKVTQEQCATKCLEEDACLAYAYRAAKQDCLLSSLKGGQKDTLKVDFKYYVRHKNCPAVKPNIFMFLADDLNYDRVGYGGDSFALTPAVDEFAAHAFDLAKMHTPITMCAPSRAVIFTGLYPFRNGLYTNSGRLRKGIKTMPAFMHELGYHVVLTGKRHLTPLTMFKFDAILEVKGSSARADFTGVDAYLNQTGRPVAWHGGTNTRLLVVHGSEEPHGPHSYTNLIDYTVDDMRNISFTHKSPAHANYTGVANSLYGFYNSVKKMDIEFEAFLATLNKAPRYLDKAVTIFTSDHGGGEYAKLSCYEMGQKVPFLIQFHGMGISADNAATRRIVHLASFVDLLPTFVDLGGGFSDSAGLDGKSFWPAIQAGAQGSTTPPAHKYVFGAHTTRGVRCTYTPYPIRSVSDGKWKFIRNYNYQRKFQSPLTVFKERSFHWEEWQEEAEFNRTRAKWVRLLECRPPAELYDLESDPHEMTNLVNLENPTGLELRMNEALQAWMVQQGNTNPVAQEDAEDEHKKNSMLGCLIADTLDTFCPAVYSLFSSYEQQIPEPYMTADATDVSRRLPGQASP